MFIGSLLQFDLQTCFFTFPLAIKAGIWLATNASLTEETQNKIGKMKEWFKNKPYHTALNNNPYLNN